MPVKLHKLEDWHWGTDGITCLDGVIYMCMGAYAPDKTGHKNWYGKFDAETLKPIGEPFIVDHGEDSSCGSPNWLQSRQQPVLPVQGVVKFAELKDGKFVDITRYGVFDKQIER